MSAIPNMKILATEAVCGMEESFPRSILVSQVHLLVHVIDEISLCGVVHSRWMFFLERFLKTLKDFVRLRARPEASMAEGWIVQEAFVYVSQYLASVDPSMPRLWTDEEDSRMHSHVPSGKGKTINMTRELRAQVDNFCLLNSVAMSKWVNMWTDAKRTRSNDREAWRRAHRGHRLPPYPPNLAMFPDLIDVEWVHKAMTDARRKGEQITTMEWEYARGCLPKVK